MSASTTLQLRYFDYLCVLLKWVPHHPLKLMLRSIKVESPLLHFLPLDVDVVTLVIECKKVLIRRDLIETERVCERTLLLRRRMATVWLLDQSVS